MPQIPVAALYYPHTIIKSENLLKTALLLWDKIECIVPRRPVRERAVRRDIAEAAELVVRPHRPSEDAQKRVHERLRQFLADGAPAWLRSTIGPHGRYQKYLVYPDKLASETWRLLEHHDLAAFSAEDDHDYSVPPALGLLLLAMLADECAGVTRLKVTDREPAYSWLMGLMTSEMGGEYLPNLHAAHLADSIDRLVTASVRIVNTDPLPLKRLIEVRQRYGDGLRPLRTKYLNRVAAQAQDMVAPGLTKQDREEMVRRFEADMQSDFKDLKRDLGFAAKDVLFSKEIGVCVLAVAGSVVMPATIPAAVTALQGVGVGALLGTHAKYQKAREKALRDHAMSWLYTVA